jgi:hypothetical protein
MPYLGLLDVAGIQEYLFRSPELRNIADASERIEQIGEIDGLFWKEADRQGASLIIAAGGVAAMRAEDRDTLRRVFRSVSTCLLAEGKGLEVVGAIHSYEEGQLATSYKEALAALERKKFRQPRSTNFIFAGLGKPIPVDQEIAKELETEEEEKEEEQEEVTGEYSETVQKPESQQVTEPRVFDLMIGRGYWLHPRSDAKRTRIPEEVGLIAVVSLDGLRMGQRFFNWLEDAPGRFEGDDEGFVEEFKAWSSSIKNRWRDAWEETVKELDALFPAPRFRYEHPCQPDRFLELRRQRMQRFRLCRHIYQGGDDLSFVCDARIALAFTAALIRRLERVPGEEERIAEPFRTLRVSAGVVFVDAHFPFSRAVRMAEDVRKTAKKRAMECSEDNPPTYMDWWVNRAGGRNRTQNETSVKPCPLNTDPDRPEDISWGEMEGALKGMWKQFGASLPAPGVLDANRDEERSPEDRMRENGRNKLKDLLSATERGPDAVRHLLSARPLREQSESKDQNALPFLPEEYRKTGFNAEGKRTMLLDGGELFDIHFPFPDGQAVVGSETKEGA